MKRRLLWLHYGPLFLKQNPVELAIPLPKHGILQSKSLKGGFFFSDSFGSLSNQGLKNNNQQEHKIIVINNNQKYENKSEKIYISLSKI